MSRADETIKVYTINSDQTHHNLATIADVMVGAKESWILHKGVQLIIFENDGKTIKAVGKFDFKDQPGMYNAFIKSGCCLSAHSRRWVENNYAKGDEVIFEVYPEEA